jgi:hypothetical protein
MLSRGAQSSLHLLQIDICGRRLGSNLQKRLGMVQQAARHTTPML